MKNTKRSAFTIVELVIVIAVIAILSAVLIPTFGAIIRDANEAADKTAASTLTSELHVYLKGNTIDSEEELMAVLNDSGIGEKLVPKALSYGHHFWFDMANQMIIAAYPDDVADMEPARPISSAEQNGPALMSDVTPLADDTTYANVGIREVYDNGYYLISSCGDLADALNLIENLKDAKDYKDLIDYLESAVENDANSEAAETVLNKVKKTTIRTQFGVFFYEGASENEHISSSASYLAGPYYNYVGGEVKDAAAAPNVSKPVSIPANIKAVMENGLNYEVAEGATTATTVVVMPSVDKAVEILTPKSSNAVIKIGDVEHIITTAECAEHSSTCDVLANKADGSIVKHLELKLAFENFYIGYEGKTDGTTKDTLVGETTEPGKIYVAYRNSKLQLHAVNTANVNETSNKVQQWTILDENKYGTGFSIDSKTGAVDLTAADWATVTVDGEQRYVCEFTVKATTKNLNGVVVEDTVTIVVIKPVQATLNLGSNILPFSAANPTYPDLTFNGPLTSYDVSFNVRYSTDINEIDPLILTPSVDIDTENIVGLLYDGSKMSFKTNASGELISETYSFKISVDGCFESTASGNIVDATAAPVRFNYKQYNQGGRPQEYYVGTSATEGTNLVKLSDLFTLSEANKAKLGNATVTIYVDAELDGSLYPSYEIKKMFAAYAEMLEAGEIDENPYTLNAKYTDAVTEGNWSSATIEFIGTVTSAYTVYVEISPEFDVSTVVRLEVINGVINVSDLNDLTADANGKITLSGNVALHGNCEIETGTTIDVGANTIYGNGWVVDAKDYVAENASVTYIDGNGNSSQVGYDTEVLPAMCGQCKKPLEGEGKCTGDSVLTANPPHENEAGWHKKNWTDRTLTDYRQAATTNYYDVFEAGITMISLDGGTIDNIYIDGPVYPDLQYTTADACKDTTCSTHDDHVNTPYYVTGIKTSGNATISNSYILGFRQPLMVEGAAAVGSITEFTNDNGTPDDTSDDYEDMKAEVTDEADNTTVENTVLHGGSYANLVIVSGNVTLNDVTTVQDFYGMTPTVDYDPSTQNFTVVGIGVVLEGSTAGTMDNITKATDFATAFVNAGHGDGTSTPIENKLGLILRPLSTKVDINGSFTQHNWVERDLGNKKLPSVPVHTNSTVEVSFVFNTIFKGVEMYGINLGRMGRFMHLTHQDVAVAGEANVGNRLTDTRVDNSGKNELVNLGIVFIDIEQAEGDPVVKSAHARYIIDIDESDCTSRKHAHAELQLSEGVADMDVTAFVTNGADASLSIWSYADGRAWHSDRDGLKAFATVIEEKTNWNKVHVVTDSDTDYSGYYATSNSYKNLYDWESNN